MLEPKYIVQTDAFQRENVEGDDALLLWALVKAHRASVRELMDITGLKQGQVVQGGKRLSALGLAFADGPDEGLELTYQATGKAFRVHRAA